MDNKNQTIKCVTIGDGCVGKTCLLISYTTSEFVPHYMNTENYDVPIMIGGEPYTLELCDTAGQDDYVRLSLLSYPQIDVFLVCFSIIHPTSFESISEKWIKAIKHCANVPYILVGTQMDLRDDPNTLNHLMQYKQKPISLEMGEKLAKKIKARKYLECSALTHKGIKEVFDEAISAALEPPKIKKHVCQLL